MGGHGEKKRELGKDQGSRGRLLLSGEKLQTQVLRVEQSSLEWSYSGTTIVCSVFPFLHHSALLFR